MSMLSNGNENRALQVHFHLSMVKMALAPRN
ncbi:hypothetical protein PIN31009_01817 [Pandoraea iniqua]|uniref:Uncharacterized protein n=1 Tax=Pandoraea iniqua TaxID=2508288 RepID=A0A5E4U5D7_9BURK|nr:hypothetical protein PIN31009_01817 [Pandoraea iniqua]VVD99040.1 hypothetical protein PIN31115_02005 [Pandoraea iniqua]